MSSLFDFGMELSEQEIAEGWTLGDDGIIFRVECKSGGYCILKPKKMSDVNCKTCGVVWKK